jgi:hypothetical protein
MGIQTVTQNRSALSLMRTTEELDYSILTRGVKRHKV